MTAGSTPSKRRILIIDDNPAIHDDFRKILGKPDHVEMDLEASESVLFGKGTTPWFEIDVAFQGSEGLEMVWRALAAERPYSLVFVDVRMPPGWDGIQTAGYIWKICPETQIVICTAYSDCSWHQMREQLDPRDRMLVLKKPFDAIEVLQMAHALTEKWSLLQESQARLGGLEEMVARRTRQLEESGKAALKLRDEALEARGRAEDALGALRREYAGRLALEERFREQASLLDKARDAIVVRDLEHRITYWNKSAERLFGWAAEEAVGCPLPELISSDRPAFERACGEVLATGEWAGEQTVVTRDGGEIVIDARWTLVRDENNEPKSVLAIHTDVTKHKELERQFLRAQRLESIGTLAGGIAHDLNNVFAPILMGLELMQMPIDEVRRKDLLAMVTASARRGAGMVRQVLSFARGVEMKKAELSVALLVDEVCKFLQETFPKNIVIECETATDLKLIEGDATQLHQVLVNLCVNARDAMPAGGRLLIKAGNREINSAAAAENLEAKPGPHVYLTVEDSGEGIPAEVVDRIFDPFFTTKEPGKGTGLGLSTSLSIVKCHGGFIGVGKGSGGGAAFTIHLPALTRPAAAPAAPAAPLWPRGRGETILVVDDEPPIRDIARQILETYGYRVLLAADGVEACSVFETCHRETAVVVTDIMMPGMDGHGAIREMARIDPGVKIVATSGIFSHGETARAAAPQVRKFLAKPYTPEDLLTTLSDIIGG